MLNSIVEVYQSFRQIWCVTLSHLMRHKVQYQRLQESTVSMVFDSVGAQQQVQGQGCLWAIGLLHEFYARSGS